MRLQKFLADCGVTSRRKAEELIAAGRVTMNGHLATIGLSVFPGARVCVDGREIKARKMATTRQVLMLNKRAGEVCSRKRDEKWPRVFDALPRPAGGRWISVGRLDVNTSGLLLFTVDGGLANLLMHPRQQIVRRYLVRVAGNVDTASLMQLKQGVVLEDGPARFDKLNRLADQDDDAFNTWYEVEVTSGRNRMVRRLWEHQGFQVSRLIRVGFGPISLPAHLNHPRWRMLAPADIDALFSACSHHVPDETPSQTFHPKPGFHRSIQGPSRHRSANNRRGARSGQSHPRRGRP